MNGSAGTASLEDYLNTYPRGQKRKADSKEFFGDNILGEVIEKLETREASLSQLPKPCDDEMMHHCEFCTSSFNSFRLYRRHILDEHEKKHPYQCEACSQCFASVQQLLTHKTTTHPQLAELRKKVEINNRKKEIQKLLDQQTKTEIKAQAKQKGDSVKKRNKSSADCLRKEETQEIDLTKRRKEVQRLLNQQIERKSKSEKDATILKKSKSQNSVDPEIKLEQNSVEPDIKIEIDVAATGSRDFGVVCNICGHGCDTQSQLISHKRNHWQEHRFKCFLCFQSFASEDAMKTHRRLHGLNSQYECFVCGDEFTAEPALQYHVNNHFGCVVSLRGGILSEGLRCVLCYQDFPTLEDLVNHQKETHPDKNMWKCNLCPQRFISNNILQKHIKNDHFSSKGKPFQCETCLDCFATVPELLKHKKDHHPILEAPRNGVNSPKANKHLNKTYVKSLRFQCDICHKWFRFQKDLSAHKRDVHRMVMLDAGTPAVPSLNFKCELCYEVFDSVQDFRDHKRKRHGQAQDLLVSETVQTSTIGSHSSYSTTVDKRTEAARLVKRMFNSLDQQAEDDALQSRKNKVQQLLNQKTEMQSKPQKYTLTKRKEAKSVRPVISFNTDGGNVHNIFSPLFTCDNCGDCFPTSKQLLNHKSKAHPEFGIIKLGNSKLPCMTALETRDIAKEMEDRKRRKTVIFRTSEIKYKCEICAKCFQCAPSLLNHKRTQHPIGNSSNITIPDKPGIPIKSEPGSDYPDEEANKTADIFIKQEIKTELEFA